MEHLVERAFVISLPFRSDRLESFRRQFSGLSCFPDIELFPAVHGDTCRPPDNWHAGAGAWGCYKSHLNILEYCLNNRVASYVVFEDDAQLRPGVELGSFITQAFGELPDDWQQLYLGGQLMHERSHPPVRFSEHLFRPFNVNRTHAFAVGRRGMLPIYQHVSRLPFVRNDHIDHHLGRWHEDAANQVFCTSQWMVGQHGSSSNVSGKVEPVEFYTDPQDLALEHWLFKTPVCVLFRGTFEQSKQCLDFLHFGNEITSNGYDVTLAEAAKYRYPGPSISRWFGWIRGEIAKEKSDRLPAVFHPDITYDQVRTFAAERVAVVEHFATPDEARQQIKEQLPDVLV